jgi:hypothetical protein
MDNEIVARLSESERKLPSWFNSQSFTSEDVFDLLQLSKLRATPGGRPAIHKSLQRLHNSGDIICIKNPNLWSYRGL